jgi:hypothetical protein
MKPDNRMRRLSGAIQILAALITIFMFLTGIGSFAGLLSLGGDQKTPDSPGYLAPTTAVYDAIPVSIGKLLVVALVLISAVLASVPAIFIDAIAAPFGADMPTLRRVWGRAWDSVFVDWFWRPLNPAAIYFTLAVAAAFVTWHLHKHRQLHSSSAPAHLRRGGQLNP